MRKEFKRNQIYPTIMLLPAILFGVIAVLQLATGGPIAILSLLTSILFFVNASWSFSTPFIILEGNKIFFKEALLKRQEVAIQSIQKIDFPKDKLLKLVKHDGSTLKIRLDMLKSDDREAFKKTLLDLHEQNPTVENI